MTNSLDQVCDQAVQMIVAELKKGVLPWRQSWGGQARVTQVSLLLPMNANTKSPYKGINIVLLWLSASLNGFTSPYWATEKTWATLGATVRPGAIPTEVKVMKFKGGIFRGTFSEYNLEQVSGCNSLRTKGVAANPDYAQVGRLVDRSGAYIVSAGKPFYDIIADTIHCPVCECFNSDIGYWTTILHELVHWTGHHSRLKRTFAADGSPEYAYEELIAELASCFLAAMLGIPERLDAMPGHVSYLRMWLNQLSENGQMLFKAAAAAQKATDYLLRFIN